MTREIVKEDNFKEGDRVVRGRDWQWGRQDSGYDFGVIEGQHHSDRWVWVRWCRIDGSKSIGKSGYRIGAGGEYDLYFYDSKSLDGRPKLKLDG